METLLDLLEDSAARYGVTATRSACGATTARRSTGATPRCCAGAGSPPGGCARWASQPGDRDPDLVAVHARAAGRLLRRDVRAADLRAARRADGARDDHAASSSGPGAVRLRPGHGPRRSRPARGGPRALPDDAGRGPLRGPGRHLPRRLGGAARRPGRARADDEVFELDLHLGHDRQPEGRDARARQRRSRAWRRSTGSSTRWSTGSCRCSRSRTSLEQAVSLFYAMEVGADILYVRSRNPRVIFERAARAPCHHDAARAPGAGPVLERDRARGREAGPDGVLQPAPADRAPPADAGARRLLFRSVHAQLGGGLRLFATAGAFLPPALQQAWEDIGVIVLQGYGATETAAGCCTTMDDHPLGCVGWPPKPVEMRIADDGEIQFRGPDRVQGLLEQPRGDRRGVHR